MDTKNLTLRIDQLPLWRLLVALDDAERLVGANSSTARALAGEIKRRLSKPTNSDDIPAPVTPQAKGGRADG